MEASTTKPLANVKVYSPLISLASASGNVNTTFLLPSFTSFDVVKKASPLLASQSEVTLTPSLLTTVILAV